MSGESQLFDVLVKEFGRLGLEAVLLLVGCVVLQQLAPVVQGTLEEKFGFPTIAKYVDALFRLGLPIAIACWFVSIVVRFIV